MNDDETMGVAVGFYRTLNKDRDTRIWINHGYGLVIFFFDKDGNITKIVFIPFKELESEDGMKQKFEEIKGLLAEHGVSMSDFEEVLENLIDFCDEMCDRSALGGGSGSVMAFLMLPSLVSGLPAVVAIGLFIDSARWDRWRDILVRLEDLAEEDQDS